jgi:two-component system phosphate regulon response regulator OmpR
MKHKSHILIVDDDNRILKLLKLFLQKNDFLISTTTSCREAIELLDNFIFDLIILDVMMPETTGIQFAKKLKKNGNMAPIVMLTALSEPEDKIKGLEAGANDYITKPFEPRELLLRINNLINFHNLYKKEHEVIRFGTTHFNLRTKELMKEKQPVKLSSSELNLLQLFIEAQNSTITREELSDKTGSANLRSIDVQIVRLRNKIEDDPKNPKFLKTIRNQGYVLYT